MILASSGKAGYYVQHGAFPYSRLEKGRWKHHKEKGKEWEACRLIKNERRDEDLRGDLAMGTMDGAFLHVNIGGLEVSAWE